MAGSWTFESVVDKGPAARAPILELVLGHETLRVSDDSISVRKFEDKAPTVLRLDGRVLAASAARRAGRVILSVNRTVFRCETEGPIGSYFLSTHHAVLFDPNGESIRDVESIPFRHETDFCVSPDGRTLVTFGPENAIWSLPEGEQLATLDQSGLLFKATVFDEQSERVVALFDGNPNILAELNDRTPWRTELKMWRRDGTAVFGLQQAYVAIAHLGFADDGMSVVGLDKERQPVAAWDAQTGNKRDPHGVRCQVYSEPAAPARSARDVDRGVRLAVAPGGTIARMTDETPVGCAMVSGSDIQYPFALCRAGATAAALAWPSKSGTQPDVVRWEPATGRRFTSLPAPNPEMPLSCLALSDDGRWAAAGGKDWTVYVWDLAKNSLCAVLAQHRAPIVSVAFSSDGRWLYSLCQDDVIVAWALGQ